ncbi:hypothetical protein [Acetonema longum]|uniref:Uncharacterized protein n=1 Tax=Acetonema longum DSM 6540 TaxID=1009370 RepID=F7NHI6_9FIRM|nr:hypothetical protein [Acetonema longum]EGO64533.1 hypothetical protein ALO_07668 [Acetonema longum DSM 6540]
MKWLPIYVVLTVCLLMQSGLTKASAPESQSLYDIKEWPVTISSYGGTLLFSDSPEEVTADGILYQDTVSGNIRVFFHHVNSSTGNKRLTVVLENPGNKPVRVNVHQYGLGGPSKNYLAVGKDAQMQYFAGSEQYEVLIPERDSVHLSKELAYRIIKPDELVNGIYDFIADQPVRVKVVMGPTGISLRQFARIAPILPKDQYKLRGTFPRMDRMVLPYKVYDPAKHGMVAITLADHQLDQYARGIDATDGFEALNYGNFGIIYRLFLPGAEGNVSYYLNPRGGVYAGAMGVRHQYLRQPPLATPNDRLYIGQGTVTTLTPLGTYAGQDSLWFTFSPPGASNLPVKIVIMPNSPAPDSGRTKS